MYQRQVSFMEAVNRAFNNYCCFTGRASRSEYWWFALFCAAIAWLLSGLILLNPTVGKIVNFVYSAIILLPSLGLCVRRLHDIGKSGWWYLIGFIPVVGIILLIVWFCKPSQPGPNQWGPEPNMTDSPFI